MSDLGSRQATGFADPDNRLGAGQWTVRFDPGVFDIPIDFEIYHIALMGPPASTFQVFIDSVFYDNVAHGDVNSWDPNQPMFVHSGSTVFFYFSTAASPAPLITVFCREVDT